MAGPYENEDGSPRYGQRLDPEELAAYRRTHGLDAGIPTSSSLPDGGQGLPPGGEVNPYRYDPQAVPPARHGLRPVGPRTAAVPPWRSPRPRHRWRLLVVGLVTMVVIPVVLLVSSALLLTGGQGGSGVALSASGGVYLGASRQLAIYSPGLGEDTSRCAVTDPAGAPVSVTPLEGMGGSLSTIGTFTTGVEGEYRLSCPQGTDGVVVGPRAYTERFGIIAVLVVAALGCGLLGLGLTVGGLVRAVRRR